MNWGGGYHSYSRATGDVYLYNSDRCREGSYCYGEDKYGNEIEIYIYELERGYGYGEDDEGNEVEFYFDYPRTISDVYLYDSYDCQEGNYCYGEDEYGNEIEVYIYEMDDGYGYGEDEYRNEVEFYYDDY